MWKRHIFFFYRIPVNKAEKLTEFENHHFVQINMTDLAHAHTCILTLSWRRVAKAFQIGW